MSMTHEQIQALKAAAESCDKQEPLSLVVYHGKMCLRNKGGIVFTVLRDISFPEYSAENENYARLAELCSPDSILSLLAERDADKALIAKLQSANAAQDDHINQQANRIESLEKMNHGLGKRLCAVEARTLTVKFNPIPMEELGNKNEGKKHPYMFGAGYNSAVVNCECVLKQACAAAGITLVVEE
ncbi:hypothetical protein [Phytobacter ursingii]|uniref:Ead/Ea22-like family protein n=1 Tax=Phytobacter ursingii TaxID=1972431 RepID=A0AB35RMB7_9ENTR|nr:hypothetical protein [Phytobacter ursingii]MDV2861822.1 hypothetical protein [Phytobacter ursingii]